MHLANHSCSQEVHKVAIALLALLPWLVDGTSADAQIPAAAVQDAQAEEAWLRHGFTGAQRDKIRIALQRGLDRKFVPGGAMLIIHRGKPILREGFGVASLETRQPFTIDAPCRIASVTKPHTSTLIAMLVEQGKLSWDDPVDKYLPTFAGIAVRDKGPAIATAWECAIQSALCGRPASMGWRIAPQTASGLTS